MVKQTSETLMRVSWYIIFGNLHINGEENYFKEFIITNKEQHVSTIQPDARTKTWLKTIVGNFTL